MGLLNWESEEMPRGGTEILDSYLLLPWIFRRNHGFSIEWAEGLGVLRGVAVSSGPTGVEQDVNVIPNFISFFFVLQGPVGF